MVNYSKNNFKIEDFKSFKNTLSAKYYRLQEHEQNIRRLGIIQENEMYDKQQAYKHLKKMILNRQLPLLKSANLNNLSSFFPTSYNP